MPGWDSEPQAHSRLSNINFDIWIWEGLCISHEQLPKDGKVLSHLGFNSKVLPRPLTTLSDWVILHLKPSALCHISILIFGFGGRGIWISHEILPKHGKVLSNLGVNSKVLPGPLNGLSAWVGFSTPSPQQDVKYQLWYLDLGGMAINIPCTIAEGWQSSFPLGAYVKGIAYAFNWLKWLGGILHLKSTEGCQISTLIFGFGESKYIRR